MDLQYKNIAIENAQATYKNAQYCVEEHTKELEKIEEQLVHYNERKQTFTKLLVEARLKMVAMNELVEHLESLPL